MRYVLYREDIHHTGMVEMTMTKKKATARRGACQAVTRQMSSAHALQQIILFSLAPENSHPLASCSLFTYPSKMETGRF